MGVLRVPSNGAVDTHSETEPCDAAIRVSKELSQIALVRGLQTDDVVLAVEAVVNRRLRLRGGRRDVPCREAA